MIENFSVKFSIGGFTYPLTWVARTHQLVAKLLRGPTAKRFFEYFPELKKQKHEGGLFWGSGLWNPSYYIGSPKNIENTINYIRKQKYGSLGIGSGQKTLSSFVA